MNSLARARILVLGLLGMTLAVRAADPVFSGPQPGEKVTSFKVVELTAGRGPGEREVAGPSERLPVALVFIHGIERSIVPLLRVVDQYGVEHKDRLTTEFVFLAADRLAGEQRVKAAASSVKWQAGIGLSVDGAEGPGNYGLNKDCLVTIVLAKDHVVTHNFALVQPGIADAPKVVTALAKLCGDENPPSVEQLSERQSARSGGGRQAGMARRATGTNAVDLTRFNLNTEAGLRDAVAALITEVQSLRAEIATLRSGAGAGASSEARGATRPVKPKEDFPGAAPSDPALLGMLRRFINPTNDAAKVDAVMQEVRDYIKNDTTLKKQALDGWTHILNFGDRYGTEYARTVGRRFVEELNAPAPKP